MITFSQAEFESNLNFIGKASFLVVMWIKKISKEEISIQHNYHILSNTTEKCKHKKIIIFIKIAMLEKVYSTFSLWFE